MILLLRSVQQMAGVVRGARRPGAPLVGQLGTFGGMQLARVHRQALSSF
jgi:hypothetical protein